MSIGNARAEIERELVRFRKTAEMTWQRRKTEILPQVQKQFDRYQNKYFIVILAPISVPPDYYQSWIERNSITGKITIAGVEPEMDFFFVDIFERPFACDLPENLDRDPFLFKANVLSQRTWVYQQLVSQLENARQGMNSVTAVTFQEDQIVQETNRADCAVLALGQAMYPIKYESPFQSYVYITFVCAFTRALGLILYTCFLSCLSLWIAHTMNVPVLFRFVRAVDCIFRCLYLFILLSQVLGSDMGSGTDVIALIALLGVLFLTSLEVFKGDIGTAMCYSGEQKYEILKVLSDKCWLCRLVRAHRASGGLSKYSAGAQSLASRMKPDNSSDPNAYIPRAISGALPDNVSESEVCLIAEFNGLLLKLEPLDAKSVHEIEAYRRIVEGRPEKNTDIQAFKRSHRRASGIRGSGPESVGLGMPSKRLSKSLTRSKSVASKGMSSMRAGRKSLAALGNQDSPEDMSALQGGHGRASKSQHGTHGSRKSKRESSSDGGAGFSSTSPDSGIRRREIGESHGDGQKKKHNGGHSSGSDGKGKSVSPNTKGKSPGTRNSPLGTRASVIGSKALGMFAGSSAKNSSKAIANLDAPPGGYNSSNARTDPRTDPTSSSKTPVARRNSIFDSMGSKNQLPDLFVSGTRDEHDQFSTTRRGSKGRGSISLGLSKTLSKELAGLGSRVSISKDIRKDMRRGSSKSLSKSLSSPNSRPNIGEGTEYEPMMISIVNIPVFNRNYPSQMHKEALFRIQKQRSKEQGTGGGAGNMAMMSKDPGGSRMSVRGSVSMGH